MLLGMLVTFVRGLLAPLRDGAGQMTDVGMNCLLSVVLFSLFSPSVFLLMVMVVAVVNFLFVQTLVLFLSVVQRSSVTQVFTCWKTFI